MTDTKLSNHEEFKKKADIKLTNELKRYADNAVTRFDELEYPASITVFIETDEKNLCTASLRMSDTRSIVINTVIKEINHLVENANFLRALKQAIENK